MPNMAKYFLTSAINGIILKLTNANYGTSGLKGGKCMYANLEAEMIRTGVENRDLARIIGKNERTVRNKKSGETEFTYAEALAIRDNLFPELTLEYLMKKTTNVSEKEVV